MMRDVENREISVDEIMQQIRERVRSRRAVGANEGDTLLLAGSPTQWSPIDESLARAQQYTNVGAALPPMSRTTGLKRMLAVPVARVFLRIAQLITRDQRIVNQAVVDASRILREELSDQRARIAHLERELGELKARSPDVRQPPEESK